MSQRPKIYFKTLPATEKRLIHREYYRHPNDSLEENNFFCDFDFGSDMQSMERTAVANRFSGKKGEHPDNYEFIDITEWIIVNTEKDPLNT